MWNAMTDDRVRAVYPTPRDGQPIDSLSREIMARYASQEETMRLLIKGLAWIGRKFVEWQKNRRAVRELYALDDRLLADIGIERHQIASVAGGELIRSPLDAVPLNVEFLLGRSAPTKAGEPDDHRIAA